MKKSLFTIIAILCCGLVFSGCIKNGTNRTIAPSMQATIATYTFNADNIQPYTSTSQINDTGTTLIISGYEKSSGDKIVISITKYTGGAGTYSIVQGQAAATYFHNGILNTATGGVVAIKDATGNVINGYFSFSTGSGIAVSNATFVCGKPWIY